MPKPVMTARLAATVLALEALCVFFATLTAAVLTRADSGGSHATAGQIWLGGAVLLVVFVVLAGVVRRPGGLVLGSLGQLLLIATGLVEPAMWAVGAAFALLWVWLVSVGRRIDADRRRWASTGEPDSTGGPADRSAADQPAARSAGGSARQPAPPAGAPGPPPPA